MRVRMVVTAVVALTLAATAPAAAYNAPGPKWPGATIRYYNAMPAKFDWVVRQATANWNRSGARVSFKEVPRRGAAQVTIAFGDTKGYAGYATIGPQRGAYAHLAPYQRSASQGGPDPVLGRLLTHELGHVIGLDHVGSTGCKVMTPAPGNGCAEPPAGYFNCSWLAADDIRGAIRLYGGKQRKPANKYCLLEPRPPALDVRISGGDSVGSPVQLQWSVPAGLRRGVLVSVRVYPAGRCQGDEQVGWLDGDESVSPNQGTWRDETGSASRAGSYCYEVRTRNQFGLESAPARFLVSRPVPSPVIGDMIEYPNLYDDYHVSATLAEGTYLQAAVSPPGGCATAYDPSGIDYVFRRGSGLWALRGIPEGAACIAFFAVDSDGAASAAVTREIVHAARS